MLFLHIFSICFYLYKDPVCSSLCKYDEKPMCHERDKNFGNAEGAFGDDGALNGKTSEEIKEGNKKERRHKSTVRPCI